MLVFIGHLVGSGVVGGIRLLAALMLRDIEETGEPRYLFEDVDSIMNESSLYFLQQKTDNILSCLNGQFQFCLLIPPHCGFQK